MKLQATKADLIGRSPDQFETDKAALALLLQQAVNVELFTIPLYMTSLYSIQGMHQITGANNLYEGRKWPGLAPTYRPGNHDMGNIKENELAFNTIFSVFIEEMLHLQLASNLCNVLGVTPNFTDMSPAPGYGWTVYSPDSTTIPGIIDFKDCKPVWPEPDSGKAPVYYENIKVKLDALNQTQNDLFLAIEAPEEDAIGRIKPEYHSKYIHTAPLQNWEPGQELPMLGSIGLMYQLIWDYLNITYADEKTLFEKVYSPGALQQDIFNASSSGHPYREYQGFETTVEGWTPELAINVVYKLISAITDQGEGADIEKKLDRSRASMLQAVKPDYQASEEALAADYPSYDDKGKKTPSSHAYARTHNDERDHYERFLEIRQDLETGKIVTWPDWHKQGNKWTAEDLKAPDYDKNQYNLPPAEDIAGALNRLNEGPNREANYKQFCEIATGAIAGITSVLNNYWQDSSVGFPFPSMGGSGDRLMMCWAVFGQVPDLSVPIQAPQNKVLYHACQGINYAGDADNTCASAEIYHNCRGSNGCRGQGGCGFVQVVGQSKSCGGGGGSCSASTITVKNAGPLCGGPKPPQPQVEYSAPSDNLCGSFGGCAVPISASQIYPIINTVNGRNITMGTMELNDFVKQPDGSYKTTPLPDGENKLTFKTGDLVHDIAWDAYVAVLASRNPKQTPPVKPAPSDLRLAFPPST